MIDNQSPPGSWKSEMERAPWAYGQQQDRNVVFALAAIRQRGMWDEAAILQQKIIGLEAEIERMTK